MSTQLAGGAASTVDALTVIGALTVGGNPLDTTFQQLVNNTGASSDVSLAVGQLSYVDVSAATSVPLKIATGDNQEYEISVLAAGGTGVTANLTLSPNNTTYTNFFRTDGWITSGGASSYIAAFYNNFIIGYNVDAKRALARVSTKLTSKSVIFESVGYTGATSYWAKGATTWQATASNTAAADSTTAWTSLGTITFPVAATGRIYIRRLA